MSRDQINEEDVKQINQLTKQLFEMEQVLDIKRLGGLTNHTYCVTLKRGKLLYRLPGEGTETLINRKYEKISTELACSVGVDSELIYFDAETGVKISQYIDNSETLSPETMRENENIISAAKIFSKIHNSNIDTKVPFNVFEMAADYEKFIIDNKGTLFEDYVKVKNSVMELKNKVDAIGVHLVPCHNDPLCENWIKDQNRLYLVDWEYAGMNEAMWDLADLSIEASFTNEMDQLLLNTYFDNNVTQDDTLRFKANKIYLDYLWSLWGKTRVPFDGKVMEQYALDRYERLVKNLNEI